MQIINLTYNALSKFSKDVNMIFNIDTLRASFNKDKRLNKLHKIADGFNLKWHKIKKHSNEFKKLKRYAHDKELTSVYRLGDLSIYYYNRKRDDVKQHYRHATLIAYGLHQYHKKPPPIKLIKYLFEEGVNNLSSVDVCYDMHNKPNLDTDKFIYTQYKDEPTYYINKTRLCQITKVCIYDKAYKNNLPYPLWRIEATINIDKLHEPSLLSKQERIEL